jgi:hypothetical protein
MRRLAVAGLLSVMVCGVALAQDAAPATMPARAQSDVPITEVALFNTGVGFFKHSGKITGDAFTELHFRREQINDILKSLVLQDRDGGHIGTVVYPSQDPVEHNLHRFQVDISSDPPLELLLQQLRGASVRLVGGNQKVEGQIIGLQQKEHSLKEGQAVRVTHPWFINILSGASIYSVSLEDVGNIELIDPELQKDFTAALTTLAKSRDQDKKTVTVNFDGAGQRGVAFAYLLETPIWKTSYRLILPEVGPDGKPKDPRATPILQGWALVENQTDADWTSVKLSLMGGHPISFLQNLYESLYVPRPVYEANFTGALNPQTYEGGAMVRGGEGVQPPSFNLQSITQNGTSGGQNAAQGGGQGLFTSNGNNPPNGAGQGGVAAQPFNPAQGIGADAEKLGDKFEYVIDRVTLRRGQSAMLPVLNDPVDARRVSIYNASVLSKNPLYGARLKNNTEKYLLEGPMTVLQGGNYAGDALLGNLSPGKSRLLTYGADQDLRVEFTTEEKTTLENATIAKGKFESTSKTLTTTKYQVKSIGDTDKTLLIEQPYTDPEKLIEPQELVEKTDTLYRVESAVPAHKAVEIKVVMESMAKTESYLKDWTLAQLEMGCKDERLPQDVRDVLADLVKRQLELAKAATAVQDKIAERAAIAADQQRIRENLKVADHKDKIYDRLETKLNDQETQLETLDKEIKDLQAELAKAHEEMQQYIDRGGKAKGKK